MTQNKLLNEFLDITKKPLDNKGFFYDMDIAYRSVKAADEFAIEFADWFVKNNYENKVGYYEASELLEIYKKEKGL